MIFCRKVCQILATFACASLLGCSSLGRGKHACAILLESCDLNCSQMVVLPVSRLSVPAIPVPLFTEKDISDVSVQRCGCGCTFAVTLTDHASYEMYQLLFDAAGRKLLLQCGGATIGFSLIGVGNDVHRLVFIPEISDEACCSLFCRDKK